MRGILPRPHPRLLGVAVLRVKRARLTVWVGDGLLRTRGSELLRALSGRPASRRYGGFDRRAPTRSASRTTTSDKDCPSIVHGGRFTDVAPRGETLNMQAVSEGERR